MVEFFTSSYLQNFLMDCSGGRCRQADAFVQLVHLLNITAGGSSNSGGAARGARDPDPSPSPGGSSGGTALCSEVLVTLTELVAGNAASRARVATDIGYDQILTVVLRQVRGQAQNTCLCYRNFLPARRAATVCSGQP